MKFETLKDKANKNAGYTFRALTSEYFYSLPIMSQRVVSNYVDAQRIDTELLSLHKKLRWYLLVFPDKKYRLEMKMLNEQLNRYFTTIYETEREQYYALIEMSRFLKLFLEEE